MDEQTKMRVFALLLVSVLTLSKCSPIERRESEVVTTANPFVSDVTACQRLPSTSTCSQWVDYEVPASIAALASIIDYDIDGKVMERDSIPVYDCSGLKEALCAFRYPRCQGSNVIMRSLPNCEQKTRNCAVEVTRSEGICSLNVTLPLDSCAAVSSYPASSRFQRCNLGSTTRVTAWMMEYLKLTDIELNLKLDESARLSTLYNPSACIANTTSYYCQFYGQCTDSGTIELTNYYEKCERFISCYSHMTADSIRGTVNCSLWPRQSDRMKPATQQPSAVPSSPASSSSMSSSSSRPRLQPTWPRPVFMFGHGISLHHCVTGTISILALFSSIFML